MNPKQLILPNGLNLILYPMSSVQSVSVYVTVGAGPRYEAKEDAGLAHFLEHMLFEGTNRFPTSKDLANYLERIGGKSSAWTDKEYVSYYVKVQKQHLSIAFDYLSDILFNSLLESAAIKKEKRIVTEEMKRSRDIPEVDIYDLWFEWTWGREQSLGRSTLGDEISTRNITRQKLKDYMERFYNPSNMVIGVVGNFSPKKTQQLALEYFYRNQKKSLPTFKPLHFLPKKIHTKIAKVNTEQTQLMLGFVTDISYHHKDRFPIRVIASILNGGASSRLFHELIYELGIAYSVWTQTWSFSDTGLFYVLGGFSSQNLEKAIKTILEELDKLKKQKIMETELKEVKEKDKAGLYFSLETPDAIANLYSSQQITEKRIMTPEEISKKIDEVSSEDIYRVAKKYFTLDNLSLTIKGPLNENKTAEIEKILLNINE